MNRLSWGLAWIGLSYWLEAGLIWQTTRDQNWAALGWLIALVRAAGLCVCARGPFGGWTAALALLGPAAATGAALTFDPDGQSLAEDLFFWGRVLGVLLLFHYLIRLCRGLRLNRLAREGWMTLLIPFAVWFLALLNFRKSYWDDHLWPFFGPSTMIVTAVYLGRLRSALKTAPVEW